MGDQYKLIYFNARGAAEPIRYIFALAGVEYEDSRVEKESWPALKPTTKWGQLPVIEINGKQMAQSVSIARFLARKYKLAGENEIEELQADEIIDAIADLKPHLRPIFHEQDDVKKGQLIKEFVDNHGKPFMAKLSKLKEANSGKWIVGNNLTWADVYIAYNLDYILTMNPSVLENYPALKELHENFYALPEIKKWVENRPKTGF